MINEFDLKYFIEAAKTKHLSRAAERLGITQPALSHSIKRVEQILKCEIFYRSKKGITLTPAGERLFEQSQNLLQLWQEVLKAAHDESDVVSGVVKLGCHSAVAQYTLPHFLPKLLQEYPKLKIQLLHELSRHITEQVVSSKLDLGIVVNPVAHPDLIIKELCRDEVTLWRTKECLNPELLLIEPSLLQTQDLLQRLKKKGFSFQRYLESSSLEVLTQLLAANTGYALLPERVVKTLNIKKLEKVSGAPIFEDRICVIFKRELRSLKRGSAVLEAILQSF